MLSVQLAPCSDAKDMPTYWSLLTPDDQAAYSALRRAIGPLTGRAERDVLARQFGVIVHHMRVYISRSADDVWKRSLCCGFAPLNDGAVAISTRQLCKLIGKCRSSINAGLQALGYSPAPMTPDRTDLLIRVFPFLVGRCAEARQWTMRTDRVHLAATTRDSCEPSESIGEGLAEFERGLNEIDTCFDDVPGFGAWEDDFMYQ